MLSYTVIPMIAIAVVTGGMRRRHATVAHTTAPAIKRDRIVVPAGQVNRSRPGHQQRGDHAIDCLRIHAAPARDQPVQVEHGADGSAARRAPHPLRRRPVSYLSRTRRQLGGRIRVHPQIAADHRTADRKSLVRPTTATLRPESLKPQRTGPSRRA